MHITDNLEAFGKFEHVWIVNRVNKAKVLISP